jgi:hypothetical protein
MAKIFVAFNFSNDGLLSRKITGFRKRFDPKYNHYSFAHMAVLAPFEVEETQIGDLTETLKEEMETFFYGKEERPKLGFTGLGIYENKRKNILYLNPYLNSDLNFCSEVILDVCKSFISKSSKYKENKKQFLPLGVFNNPNDLRTILDHAKEEFTNYGELPIKSISVYENRMGIWVEKETLVNFEENLGHFLQLNDPSI